jgi:hypothetical protein
VSLTQGPAPVAAMVLVAVDGEQARAEGVGEDDTG